MPVDPSAVSGGPLGVLRGTLGVVKGPTETKP